MKNIVRSAFLVSAMILASLVAAPSFAQSGATKPVSQAQLEANKKLVLDFFMNGNALADPQAAADKYLADDYVQHNPRFAQYNEEHHVSSKVGFVQFIKDGALANVGGGQRGARAGGPPARTAAVVMAEGDLVTVIWKNTMPVPGDASKTYDAFAFDTFRIRNGKFVEHWDNATLAAPPQAGRGNAGAAR